jgi:hypothetical protein
MPQVDRWGAAPASAEFRRANASISGGQGRAETILAAFSGACGADLWGPARGIVPVRPERGGGHRSAMTPARYCEDLHVFAFGFGRMEQAFSALPIRACYLTFLT